ncbi:MAG: aldehyde dehydrogenase family protein [bacterium]
MALKVDGDALFSTNPRTGEIIGQYSTTNPDDIPTILQKVSRAFEDWSSLSLTARLELFKKSYRQFYQFKDEMASLISAETGKPLVEAYSCEILPVLDCFKYYIKNIGKIVRKQKIKASNPLFKVRKGVVTYEPLGVVAVISPWNFPFLLSMQHIIPAILAGNVVIHKPSEYTTLTGLKIREIFNRAYLPRNVLEVVTGLANVGSALVNQRLDKIIFTGSTAIGQKIYAAAARNMVPVNMELGGSDPMIVLEDANLDRAANAAVWGAFSNAGQTCLAVERLFVHESLKSEFLELLIQKARKLHLNSENRGAPDMSCLANAAQLKKIESLVRDAVKKGAVVKLGGKVRRDLGEHFFEPTILTNVGATMQVLQRESFGPLLAVQSFQKDEEAVAMANDSEFGLSASIWTQNPKRAQALAKQIQAGSVLINDLLIHIAQIEAPYTGHKKSGLGVSHGPWGVMEVVKPKYINRDRAIIRRILRLVCKSLADNDLWWFKYSQETVDDFRGFAQFLHGESIWKKVKAVPRAVKALFRKHAL